MGGGRAARTEWLHLPFQSESPDILGLGVQVGQSLFTSRGTQLQIGSQPTCHSGTSAHLANNGSVAGYVDWTYTA